MEGGVYFLFPMACTLTVCLPRRHAAPPSTILAATDCHLVEEAEEGELYDQKLHLVQASVYFVLLCLRFPNWRFLRRSCSPWKTIAKAAAAEEEEGPFSDTLTLIH